MIGSNLNHGEVSIGTAAAQIIAGRTTRKSLLVRNIHATQILYVGGSGVTTANGMKVKPDESVEFADFNGTLYGVADGAATAVRFLEVY